MNKRPTTPPLVPWGVLLLLAGAGTGVCAPQAESDARLCTINGIVTDASTGQGLRKAFVRLLSRSATYPAVTDDRGFFKLDAIPPGTYVLEAESVGFIPGRFGDSATRRNDVQLRLEPGQTLTDIAIRLTPQSVISGRVLDEDGDVWPHAQAHLFRSAFIEGRRRLQGMAVGEVNDQGEFRIGQIPPGRYYLSVEPDRSWEYTNRPRKREDYTPRQSTWFPSSTDVQGATPVVVSPGSQLAGLEVRLRRERAHVIRGVLTGLENVPAPDRSQRSAARQISARPVSDADADDVFGLIRQDGSFEIPNVSSGEYEIHVKQGFPPIELGSAGVRIDDRDVEDVSIPLVPPRPVRGIIQLTEAGSMRLSGIRVQLESTMPPAISRADGSFEFPLVGAGRYRVAVLENGFYVKEIRYGDDVSADGSVSFTGANGILVLSLSTRGARLAGRVTIASGQNSDQISVPQVVLISGAPAVRPRRATLDQNGGYSFRDLPPGKYKLYAFEDVPDGAWEDPDFVKELASAGVEIPLAEGDERSVDVALLRRSDLAPTLTKLGME